MNRETYLKTISASIVGIMFGNPNSVKLNNNELQKVKKVLKWLYIIEVSDIIELKKNGDNKPIKNLGLSLGDVQKILEKNYDYIKNNSYEDDIDRIKLDNNGKIYL